MSIETGYCNFPLCQRKAEKNGYCICHKIYSDAPVEKKAPYKMPKKSAKRKQDDKQYKKIIKAQVKKDNRCKVKSPECTGEMEGMNHIQKRSPNNLLEKDNLTPLCNACNRYIEEHPQWAKNHGHLISRFVKNKVQVTVIDPELKTLVVEEI